MRRLGSTIINALLILMSGLSLLSWFLAPPLVSLIAHGFPMREQNLVLQMVRWLMPGVIATSVSGVCTAQLNANRRFLASALVMVAANAVTIGIVIALNRELGIFALVIGSVLGLFAQLLIQIPSIIRLNLYRFELDLGHPGLARVWALLVPIAVGSGASQINLACDRYFAASLVPGTTAAMSYTAKLAYLPLQVVAGSIATVIFPLVAGQFANSNKSGIGRSVTGALGMVSFLVIPAAFGLSALASPIIRTLFERGAFGPPATALCVSLVPFASFQLIAVSYVTVLGRACYACKKVRSAVLISICAVAVNIVLSAAWLHVLGARGLLLANGVAGFFAVALQASLLWRMIGRGLPWRPLLVSLFRTLLASFIMVGALHLIRLFEPAPGPYLSSRALNLIELLAAGALVYAAASRVLGAEELSIVTRLLLKKFTPSA